MFSAIILAEFRIRWDALIYPGPIADWREFSMNWSFTILYPSPPFPFKISQLFIFLTLSLRNPIAEGVYPYSSSELQAFSPAFDDGREISWQDTNLVGYSFHSCFVPVLLSLHRISIHWCCADGEIWFWIYYDAISSKNVNSGLSRYFCTESSISENLSDPEFKFSVLYPQLYHQLLWLKDSNAYRTPDGFSRYYEYTFFLNNVFGPILRNQYVYKICVPEVFSWFKWWLSCVEIEAFLSN